MPALWIEYDTTNTTTDTTTGDSTGDSGSARWGTATDTQIDQVLAYAHTLIGEPDTTT